MEQKRYTCIEVTLEPNNYDKIKEVYRLHKEQANRLFDLTSGIYTDEDIMELIKNRIEYETVLLIYDEIDNRYAGCITFANIEVYKDTIINTEVHPVISKRYWGKSSRDIINSIYEFIDDNFYPINRLEARVPSNNFGVIKLLKDVGFTIEGTLKNRLIYKDKYGNEKYYNQLIYSNMDRRK